MIPQLSSTNYDILIYSNNLKEIMDKYINKKFNKWTILTESGRDKKSNKLYLCKCDCGTEKIQRLDVIINNISTQCKSCILIQQQDKYKELDITGQRFGSWTILERILVKSNSKSKYKYIAKCDCGFTTIKPIDRYAFTSGHTTKCYKCRGKNNKTHGMSYTATFKVWSGLFRRCYNTNFKAYKYYGGRGIIVAERWHKFENFLKDMGEKPHNLSIDRINNDGNYEPDNCRWATAKEQRDNQRPPSKRIKIKEL